MTEDPHRWSQPFAALLGAYSAQLGFGLPSIGGKDSMSGTFNDIDVPPTLVSFAVDIASHKHILTPELKKAGNKLVLIKMDRDAYDLPDYEQMKDLYGKFFEDVKAGRIVSAYALDGSGLAAAVSKMAFGNKLGVKIEHNVDKPDLSYRRLWKYCCRGGRRLYRRSGSYLSLVGEVTERGISYADMHISTRGGTGSLGGSA